MNSAGLNSASSPAFAGFLAILRQNGFVIDLQRHLRLEQLLAGAAGTYRPEDLRTWLCPLFASTPEQQERFYEIFDSYFARWNQAAVDKPQVLAQSPPAVRSNPSTFRSNTLIAGLMAPLVVGLVVGVFVGAGGIYTVKTQRQSQAARAAQSGAAPAEVAIPAAAPRGPVEMAAPLPPIPQIPPVPDSWKFLDYSLLAASILIIGSLAVRGARNRKLADLAFSSGARLPRMKWHSLSLPPASRLFPGDLLRAAATHLNTRQESSRVYFDVARSIATMVRNRGYPGLIFSRSSRQPRYLVLIDRVSFRDHLAALQDSLASALASEGVVLQIYFFDADPRVCWQPASQLPTTLERLAGDFADAHLFVFSDGVALTDAWTGQPCPWTSVFQNWGRRGLFVPDDRQHGRATRSLLPVYPASLEAILMWASGFDDRMPAGSADPVFDALPANAEPESTIAAIRRQLPPNVFTWLAACAVYPELDWKLTLHLGGLNSMPRGLLQERNIRLLSDLPWFRTGRIPEDLRLALLPLLPDPIHRDIRQALLQLLERARPETVRTSPEFRLLVAIQKYWSLPPSFLSFLDLRKAFSKVTRSDFTAAAAAEVEARKSIDPLAKWKRTALEQASIARPKAAFRGAALAAAGAVVMLLAVSVERSNAWTSGVLLAAERGRGTTLGPLLVLDQGLREAESRSAFSESPLLRLGSRILQPASRIEPAWRREVSAILAVTSQRREASLTVLPPDVAKDRLLLQYLLLRMRHIGRNSYLPNALTMLWYTQHAAAFRDEPLALRRAFERAAASGLAQTGADSGAVGERVQEMRQQPYNTLLALAGLAQLADAAARTGEPKASEAIRVRRFDFQRTHLIQEKLQPEAWVAPQSASRDWYSQLYSAMEAFCQTGGGEDCIRFGPESLIAPKDVNAVKPELQTLSVVLYTDFSEGKVLLDGNAYGDLQGGQLRLDNLAPGKHTVRVLLPGYEATFRVDLISGQMPVVVGPVTVKNALAVIVANAGTRARVYTSAPNLQVFIDGAAAGQTAGKSLEVSSVRPGYHEFRVEDGSLVRSLPISTSIQPTVTAHVQSIARPYSLVESTAGFLVISTGGEDDVSLFLNDREYQIKSKNGQIRLPGIPVGIYSIRVSKVGFFNDPPKTVPVSRGRETRVEFTLRRLPDSVPLPPPNLVPLRINGAVPGTEIYLDGNLLGTVSGSGSFEHPGIQPGEHAVELRRAGYVPKSIPLQFRIGGPVVLRGADLQMRSVAGAIEIKNGPKGAATTVPLERKMGTLELESNPPGAIITIDGKEYPGKTPSTVPLTAGKHSVTLSLPGKPVYTRSFEMRPDSNIIIGANWQN